MLGLVEITPFRRNKKGLFLPISVTDSILTVYTCDKALQLPTPSPSVNSFLQTL